MADDGLAGDALERASRHLLLGGFSAAAQRRIAGARVAVVGAGGLGCPALAYLAGAGVGEICLIDDDKVAVSNLHRQILYTAGDVGRPKATAAAERLRAMNPSVSVEDLPTRINDWNATELLGEWDIVLDGSDNFETRYAVNAACLYLGIPLVTAGVVRFEGQVTILPGDGVGPCWRCIYPDPPETGAAATCSDAGIFGPAAGILGAMQAAEALKILARVGEPLTGRLLLADIRTMQFNEIRVRRNPRCPHCGATQG